MAVMLSIRHSSNTLSTARNQSRLCAWGASLKQLHKLGTHKKRMTDRLSAWISASELTTLYARGELSPVEVIDAMVERASKLQPFLNALVLIDAEGAHAAAKASEGR